MPVASTRPPGRPGRALLVLLWIVLGVVALVSGIPGLRLATGASGVPGTVVVEECTALGRGRYDCRGTFTADAGGSAVPVVAPPESTAGERWPAQLDPADGRTVRAGPVGVWTALAVPLLGIAVLALAPLFAFAASGTRRGRRAAALVGIPIAALAMAGALGGVIVSS
ncbi:hypothetical protein SAMN05443637_12952 [Pseudonocardia thermophila]|uniref:Uncharacterized protein n=1 Tax=Pseudonocardia thermophila TaxID=1848 RepID=A0A1M7AR65_PSETH|nr:hypothetical protein [Pseudonocardia thermophila]SHL45223.1 hypothetical protein SAMN05443637_12952 [Pseudonocardia thermophila]